MLIATVIAAGMLDDRLIAAAIDRVPGARWSRWIDEGDAAELDCDGDPHLIRRALEGMEGVDVVVCRAPRRKPRVFVADMDSTMIGQECIDELADYAGVKERVAAITDRAMRGELDFKSALAERVSQLRGLRRKQLLECRQSRIHPNPGAATLVATLNAIGIQTALVSGGFTDFVEPVAKALGFQHSRANALEWDGGRLTGRTLGPIVDRTAKKAFADALLKQAGAGSDQLVAIGDGANDSDLVGAAGIGIGYRPRPALDQVANAALRHHDLTAALWMLGIARSRWIMASEPESMPAA